MEITFVLLLAGMFAAQFFYFRSYLKKNFRRPEGLEEVRKEVDALITELNQNADRNLTLMEQRLGQVQKLLAEADRRLLLLKKAEEKSQNAAQVYTHLQKAKPVVQEAPTTDPEPELLPAPTGEVFLKDPVAGSPALTAQQEKPEVKPKSTASKVQDLADAGLDPATIARNLGITLGEVELILSLRRPQGRG